MTDKHIVKTNAIRRSVCDHLIEVEDKLENEGSIQAGTIVFKHHDKDNKPLFDITVDVTAPEEPVEPVVMDQEKRDMIAMQLDELARKVQRGHNVPMAIRSHTIRPLAKHANRVVHDGDERYSIEVMFERPRGMPFIPGTALNVYPEGPSLGEKDES